LGTFWRALQWKMSVYFMNIWYILRTFDILYGHLVYFVLIWYIFPRVGILYQKIWQPWKVPAQCRTCNFQTLQNR
jgi:hypothetical protein